MARNTPVDLNKVRARIEQDGADATLTLGEAAALVAEQVEGVRDYKQSARNRVRMQMIRAQEKSSDCSKGGLACLPDKKYTVDEIARWAGTHYPGQFKDLPTKPRDFFDKYKSGFSPSDQPKVDHYPGTLAEAHEEIRQLREAVKQDREEREQAEVLRKRELVDRFKGK